MESEINLSRVYTTRDGSEVRLLEILPSTQRFRVMGALRGNGQPPWSITQWTMHGSYVIPATNEHPKDLVEASQQGLF